MQFGPEVWAPPCISSLQGPGREHQLACRHGRSRKGGLAPRNCVWGALQRSNATLGFSGPASVPYCNVP